MNLINVMDTITGRIQGLGINNVIQAVFVPEDTVRSDRKPVVYMIPDRITTLPEHPEIEEYTINLYVVTEADADKYGTKALRECYEYTQSIKNDLLILSRDDNIPIIAYISHIDPPKSFMNDPFISMAIISIAVSSYQGD